MVVTGMYDSVAARYSNIVLNFNCEAAIREYKNNYAYAYGDNRNMLFTNPGDYDLYYLADFDPESGVITPVNAQCIAKGLQIFYMVDEELSNGYEENNE